MASVRAGVVGAAEVNGPLNSGGSSKLWDPSSGGFWAVVWFAIAVIMLFVIL